MGEPVAAGTFVRVLKHRGAAAITIDGPDEAGAAAVERLLARKLADAPADEVEQPLADVVARPGFRWRELDALVAERLPAFDERFAALRRACGGWDGAEEEDRVEWLRWWTSAAWKALPIRVPGALPLFLAGGETAERRRAAESRLGAETVRAAVRWRERHGTAVVRTAAGSRTRAHAERLLAAGLARAGDSIPLPDLLAALETKTLAAFAASIGVERGRTKAVTIVHLCRSGADAAALAEHAPLDELVRLERLPAPLDELTLDAVDAPARVAEVTAGLLAATYAAGVRNVRRVERDARGAGAVVFLRCCGDDETCAECRRHHGRRFQADRRPRMPLHPGCRCVLRVVP